MTKRKRSNNQANDISQDAPPPNATGEEVGETISPTSKINSKTAQVGVETVINNSPLPDVVITDNSSSSCLTFITTNGTRLYEV